MRNCMKKRRETKKGDRGGGRKDILPPFPSLSQRRRKERK